MNKKTRIILGVVLIFAVGSVLVFLIFRNNRPSADIEVHASSQAATITSQGDWQSGTLTNIDSSSFPGSIKMDTKTGIEQSLSGVTVSSQGASIGSPSILLSNQACTTEFTYSGAEGGPGAKTLTFDLGEVMQNVFGVLNYGFAPEHTYAYSSDGVQWTAIGLGSGGNPTCDPDGLLVDATLPFTGRYLRMTIPTDTPSSHWTQFRLFQLSSQHIATIDGGVNFWHWDSFTDAKTVPANTSIAYRYRTSTNGSDWTGWVADIASVTSRTGDDSNNPTLYRYLQAEATLSNTDGASTPTIDQYDIGYHTEQKPTKPTAQTAVTQ